MKLSQGLVIAAAIGLASATTFAQETKKAEVPAPAADAAKPAQDAPKAGAGPAKISVKPMPKKPRPPAKPMILQKWGEIDADKDGKASFEDVTKVLPKFPLARFNAFDKDKDKMLTRGELPRPGGKPGTPPRDTAKAAAAGLIPLIQQADTDKDGKVTEEEFKKALPNAPASQFKELDRNGDGTLGKGDLPPQRDPQGGFLRADADKDGRVSAAEFKEAFPKSPEDRFTKLDKNKDGFLDKVDRALTAPAISKPAVETPKAWPDVIKNLIAQSDTDKDDKLTFEEFSKDKPGMSRTTFDTMDTNKDGVISIDDKQPAMQKKPGRGAQSNAKERFNRADKNGDGKLTYEEAKTEFKNLTEESFKARDTDGDGMIGPNDRPARPAPKPAPAPAPAPTPAPEPASSN